MVALERMRLDTGLDMELARQGRGRKVIFLHGICDSWYSHHGVLLALPDGIEAIVPSQRGHGGSGKPAENYAMADFAADIIALMDRLDIERAPVVGHSMGSLIGQELALRHPERVAALVLNSSATTADNAVLRGLRDEARRLGDPIDRGFVAEFQAGTCAKSLGPGMDLERAIDESMKMPAHVWAAAFEGLTSYRPAEPALETLAAIACPTLIIWGDKDEIFRRPEQDRLLAGIPGSRLSVYEGAGHGLHWEEPQRFAGEVCAFLAAAAAV